VASTFSMTGSLRLDPRWTDDLNTTTVLDSARVNLLVAFANGTGAGQADAYWRDVRTVAAGDSDSIDTAALPLDAFGGTGLLDMTDGIRLLYLRNRSSDSDLSLTIDDDVLVVPPDGVLLMSTSTAVLTSFTAANQGSILVSNDGTSAADYEIILVGVES